MSDDLPERPRYIISPLSHRLHEQQHLGTKGIAKGISKAHKPWTANRELSRLAEKGLSRGVSRAAWQRRINSELEAKKAHKPWIREGLNREVQTVNLALFTSKIPVFQFTVCTSWFARPWVFAERSFGLSLRSAGGEFGTKFLAKLLAKLLAKFSGLFCWDIQRKILQQKLQPKSPTALRSKLAKIQEKKNFTRKQPT